MRSEMNLVFCVLVLLTGASQARGQSSASPPTSLPSHAGSSLSPDLTEDPEVSQRTHSGEETSTETITKTEGTVHSETVTHSLTVSSAVATPSAATDNLSSTPTVQSATPPQHTSTPDGRVTLTTDPLSTFSSQPAATVQQDTGSTAHASATASATATQPQSESLTTATTQPTTTGGLLTSAPGRGPLGPAHQQVPSEFNAGDEDLKGPRHRSSSPLDPLLAGLLSVFIVTTAVVFVVLFLKFRQRTNHPEFHRLQDLPMDDLMEDTPLSRYTY